MTAEPNTVEPDTVEPPGHPLHQLTTFEFRNYRYRLETAIASAVARRSSGKVFPTRRADDLHHPVCFVLISMSPQLRF